MSFFGFLCKPVKKSKSGDFYHENYWFLDSNFHTTALPTFVNQRNQNPFPCMYVLINKKCLKFMMNVIFGCYYKVKYRIIIIWRVLLLYFEILFSHSFLLPACSNLPVTISNNKIFYTQDNLNKCIFGCFLALNKIFFKYFHWWNFSKFSHNII